MPHKRNPALSALIRSAAYQVPSLVGTLMQASVHDDERPAGAWHAEWAPLRDCLRLAGGAAHTAAELTEGLTVHAERMRANLDLTGGLVVSERLAALLSVELGRAEAKALLGRASAEAATTGRHLADVLADALAQAPAEAPAQALPEALLEAPAQAPAPAGRRSADDLRKLSDPGHYTGAAGQLVDRVLGRFRLDGRADGRTG